VADVVGQAVLELSTDTAKVTAGIADLKNQIKGIADTADAASSASADDWATIGRAIAAVSKQIADQRARTDELRQHNTALGDSFRDLKATVSEIAGAFGVAFSIGYAVEFLRSIGEQAEALKNLSLQTQINIEDLQVLGAATKDYGVDSDELGRALFALKQRIAGGDDSVASAYHLMGMRLKDVKDLDAVSLFLATERGLGSLSGAVRDAAAADLFGGRLGAGDL